MPETHLALRDLAHDIRELKDLLLEIRYEAIQHRRETFHQLKAIPCHGKPSLRPRDGPDWNKHLPRILWLATAAALVALNLLAPEIATSLPSP